jgi:hypothetical protein
MGTKGLTYYFLNRISVNNERSKQRTNLCRIFFVSIQQLACTVHRNDYNECRRHIIFVLNYSY